MSLVRTLFERDQQPTNPILSKSLRDLYDGDLHFQASPARRPYVIGNFVSTLDGVASYKIPGEAGGATISGSNPGDRFIMGLLRASVDAVMVGSQTVHDVGSEALWIPEQTYPSAKRLYREYRLNVLHKSEYPFMVIVSGSGSLELGRAVFRTPAVHVVIVTTSKGRERLTKAGVSKLSSVEVCTLDASAGRIDHESILQLLHGHFGVNLLLHEGGPTLFGQFLAGHAIDELFLTLSPQIAGRAAHTARPGVVENIEFTPESAPWLELVTVKQKDQHLYLRYRNRSFGTRR